MDAAGPSERLLQVLACPKDGDGLCVDGRELVCPHGHRFPVVGSVPVLLRDDKSQTMELAHRSIAAAAEYIRPPARPGILEDELFLDSLGASDDEKEKARSLARKGSPVDPVVSVIVAATSGYAYKHLVGNLDAYPFPDIRLEEGRGTLLLDVGCNWGRWSVAASRKGYRVVGIDPSLSAVMAARRVALQMGLDIDYVCGDARFLPFRSDTFGVVYSYSVLQHFSRRDAQEAIDEAARVLKAGGRCLVQMAHAIGIRSLYHQARRGFAEGDGFDVRYWTIPSLHTAFSRRLVEPRVSVHCYFGLGLEATDLAFLSPGAAWLLRLSEVLRRWSAHIPLLTCLADSVYVSARKARSR